jgi:hypothetical protein
MKAGSDAGLLAKKLIRFYGGLKIETPVPKGVGILHPQQKKEVLDLVSVFFHKFYHDNASRRLIIGINPGRFGAGITGINFTAPRQLRNNCGIEHSFGDSSELSAEFIYEVIEAYGGSERFYKDYFITSVSPLGFVQDGKNLNYYDIPSLQKALIPFINACLNQQFAFGFETERCICIGGEKNFKFLARLNEDRKIKGLAHFKNIIPLPHPRFIMQYRRKKKDDFIRLYLEKL